MESPIDTEPRTYSIDGVVFDPVTGELSSVGGGDAEVRLPPKPARLLALLLERPGALVPREEVVRELWPDQRLDVDRALAYTVRQVRAALGDEAGEPRYVETLPRRGYRFVGTLDVAGSKEVATAPGPPRQVSGGLRSGPFVTIAIVLFIGVFAWLWVRGQLELRRSDEESGAVARSTTAAGPVRIALLPLETTAAGDRLTEALLVALAEHPGLDVIGPATTRRLRGTDRPHPEIGRELGVAFVASGTWRPGPADQAVLFLQLVRVSDGGHVFARRYPGSEAEVTRRLPEAAAGLAAAASEEAPALNGSASRPSPSPPSSPPPRRSAGAGAPGRSFAAAG